MNPGQRFCKTAAKAWHADLFGISENRSFQANGQQISGEIGEGRIQHLVGPQAGGAGTKQRVLPRHVRLMSD